MLINVGKRDLESLGRFYSESNEVTVGEFERFVEYLSIDPYVIAWEWVPEVPADTVDEFVRREQQKFDGDFRFGRKMRTVSQRL